MLLTYCSQLIVVLEKKYILLFQFNDYRFIIYKSVAVKRNFAGSEQAFSCKDNVIALFLLSQLTILSSFYIFPLFPASFPSHFFFKIPLPEFFSLHCSPSHYYTQKHRKKNPENPSGTRIIFILVIAFILPLPPTLFFSHFHCRLFGTGTVCYHNTGNALSNQLVNHD